MHQAPHLEAQSTRWPPPSKGTGVERDAGEQGSEHDAACWALRKGLCVRGTRGWVLTMLRPHATPSSLGNSHVDHSDRYALPGESTLRVRASAAVNARLTASPEL